MTNNKLTQIEFLKTLQPNLNKSNVDYAVDIKYISLYTDDYYYYWHNPLMIYNGYSLKNNLIFDLKLKSISEIDIDCLDYNIPRISNSIKLYLKDQFGKEFSKNCKIRIFISKVKDDFHYDVSPVYCATITLEY